MHSVSPLVLAGEELGARHSVSRQRASPIGLLQDIKAAERWLGAARLASRKPRPEAAKAAEWLLDNDYQVNRALRQIEKDLPEEFFARLPALSGAKETGPRVFALAHELLRASHLQLSLANAVRFIRAYQRHQPLSIAELWAFPTMLRIACIEILAAALTPMLAGQIELGFRVSACAMDPHSLDPTERVARSIANLAEIAAISWEDFFERTSLVEEILQSDPEQAYRAMDFETRDRYRAAVEEIALWANASEIAVANEVISKARARGSEDVAHHVGYWLIDQGRAQLEHQFAARPDTRRRAVRLITHRPGLAFSTLMVVSGLLCAFLPAFYLARIGATWPEWIAALLLSQIPASILAITLVNAFVTKVTDPRVLPKLDCKNGLPRDFPVALVVPVIVASEPEAQALARRLEMHWLANSDPGLQIVLLADPADASAQVLPQDAAIASALETQIIELNQRHGSASRQPFHLLMRPRQFNRRENCWMAWERKRGKLEQFNRMVAEGDRTSFSVQVGNIAELGRTRLVVTVDADTILPASSVAKLAGVLAHPLNRPVFDSESHRLIRGYTLIQPRVEVSPSSGEMSLFARLFTGETAIDIYSRAVSDVYQDLFGAGTFVGKGIYDLAAFHASVDGRVPENAILSHDLFEGALGRAALATDIVLYETFPATYMQYASRQHRWIRGDWQLLPWLGRRVPASDGTRVPTTIGALDRWKMIDNLRRSLVAPGLVLLALAGWLVLPGSPWFWTALVLLAPAGQLSIDLVTGLARGRRSGATFGFWGRMSDRAGRWLLVIVYMLHEAMLSLHAIIVTLWRLAISKRNLLEWTTAAHVALSDSEKRRRPTGWLTMILTQAVAAGFAIAVVLIRPAAFAPAALLLLPWFLAPQITRYIERARKRATTEPGRLDTDHLLQLARKTWLYFETFAGPGDNWLPPDNFQGPPHEEIAHRTSPTNIGMLLLSTVSAWDLGFVGRTELVARTRNLFESLERLERYRGHFLNWYETHHLRPLEPRYVSTVDSGNLAASLLTYAQGLRDAATDRKLEVQRWSGLRVLVDLIANIATDLAGSSPFLAQLSPLSQLAKKSGGPESEALCSLRNLVNHDLAALREEGSKLMGQAAEGHPDQVGDMFIWLDRLQHHLQEMLRDADSETAQAADLLELAQAAEKLAWEMDFTWLYDRDRSLFYIGYNLSTAKTDQHHYDLLASEARLASFFAIAKRDVPVEHWFHLGRPVTRASGGLALVSWNGSMFEYLMPRLFLPSEPETLLGESDRVAVALHRQHARKSDTPWGISESAYSSRDPEYRFRYQAFGVPGLGLRRGLERDIVIAPYASALALAVDPVPAQANLKRLESLGAGGRYGLWEAIDYTPERTQSDRRFAPVNAFMAHHQGMVLCAITNVLTGDLLVSRFTRDPRIQLTTLLLSERVPHELPAEIKRLESGVAGAEEAAAPRIRHSWAPVETGAPQTFLVGNGRLSSWVSTAGGGGLRWNGQSVTRFVPDATRDADGAWLYLRDEHSEKVWSATLQPTGIRADDQDITFGTHAARFQRRDQEINTRLEIAIGANDDIEIRHLTISNQGDRRHLLRLSTCAEIVLAPPLQDERHPAFSKLFVGSEHLAEPGALLFRRRPRSPKDTPPVLLQAVIGEEGIIRDFTFETDRRKFIGRNRTVREPLGASRPLSNSQGWTLDPVAALQVSQDLAPGESRELCFVTIVAPSRAAALQVLERHATLSSIRWLLDDAEAEASRAIRRTRVDPAELPQIQALSAMLVYPHGALRAAAEAIRANRLGQSSLWGLALSGDFPILLLRRELGDDGLLKTIIGAHQLWRRAGLEVDIVILQSLGSAYIEPLRNELHQLLLEIGATEMLGRQGGIHLAFADQIGSEQVRLLEAMAWVVLDNSAGSIAEQLRRSVPQQLAAPPIVASLDFEPERERPLYRPDDLLFDNGFGGFTQDGREYVIHLDPGQSTPAPWCNVLANDEFGTIVTESGGGFTWAINSGEHRLTAWTNDPVSDRQSEILYLRDEETAHVWSVTPDPAGRDAVCQVRHGAGYTEWRQRSRGIDQRMKVSVAPGAPVKFVHLTLRNLGARARRITATYYAEWLLGALPSVARRHVHCRFDRETSAILATNPWSAEFAGRAAFLTATLDPHGFTTDREEFLGRQSDLARPAALRRWGLAEAEVSGGDACAAYQVHIDLAKGETVHLSFALGEAETEAEAIELAREWRSIERIESAEKESRDQWDDLLGMIEVTTPDRSLDVMVNRWLLYQSLSSRVMARTGFYQASGAIGFRDQLQDVLALVHADPARTRAHILECAAHQFEQGDVLHWWHPPAGRGVRTRCSDDLLWLPYAVGHYVQATGDMSILQEEVRFLQAPPLVPEEHDRYALFDAKSEPRPLIEHCERALERVVLGSHRLPLIGAGDWNDGMDRVGDEGQGESVWLAWFAAVCAASLAYCERRLDRIPQARHWAERSATWRRNAEASGWDGEWYRRAYDDEGMPLGSIENDECRIDSISQSWSVFAGANAARSRIALAAGLRELVDEQAGIARLLWPPFDKAAHDPGYIKSYPPGIRENGGQYSHAAAWLGLAFAKSGKGRSAHHIFNTLNPIHHSFDRLQAESYRTEPYALAADIGSVAPHRGMGGWTWYTGAAAWTWRLAVEGILGLTLREGRLHIAPSLPEGWDNFEARLRRGGGTIHLHVKRVGERYGRGGVRLEVDGERVEGSIVAFPPSGEVRQVVASIGGKQEKVERSLASTIGGKGR